MRKAVDELLAELCRQCGRAIHGFCLEVAREARLQQGAHGRRADDRPHLLIGVEHARGRAGQLRPDLTHRYLSHGREDHAHAQPRDADGREKVVPAGVGSGGPDDESLAEGEENKPAHQDELAADPVRQPARNGRDDHRDQRPRHDGEPGLQGGHAADRLQVDDEGQQESQQSERHRGGDNVREAEVAVLGEQRQWEQRFLLATLPEHKGAKHNYAGRDGLPDRDWTEHRAPVLWLALDQAVNDPKEADAGEQYTDQVEVVSLALPEVGDNQKRGNQDGDANRDVEIEDRAPGEIGREPAAHGRARSGSQAGHCPPYAKCGTPPLAREDGGDDGQGLRRHQGATHALDDAKRNQLTRVLGEAAGSAGGGEDHEAGGEYIALPEQVAQSSGRNQQDRVDQDVGVQDPEDLIERRLEPVDDARDRDVHDGGVEQDHEEPEAEHQ